MCRRQQVAEHVLATQVEVAILQAYVFVGLLVMMKRRRLGLVERLELMRQHFDLAGTHVRIDGAFGTRANQAFHLEHVLGTNSLGLGKDPGAIGVEDDLQQPLAVAKIDKNHAAVVAPPVHPAANLDLLTNERLVDLSAIMTTHREIRGKPLKKEAEWYGETPGGAT